MSDWRANTTRFYGWYMVGALFVILFNVGGMGFYVFPVFIESFREEFGWNMMQIGGSAAVWAIVFGFSGPLVGLLIARFGARKTMLIAAALASLTNLGFAAMQKLWMLYTINFVAGFVVAGTTLVPAQTLITNWFDKYRGRAMALTMLGIGFGGALLPPFNEFFIRQWGWRMTWVFACVILWLVIIPLIAIFVRTRPSDIGLAPDGTRTADKAGEKAASVMRGLPVRRAAGTPAFWLLFSIYVLQLIGLSAVNFHFIPFAIQEVGFSSREAALFLGLAVGFSIVGRLLFGWLADRFKPALLLALAGILLALGPGALEVFIIRAGVKNVHMLWFYALPYGIGIGANAVVLPVLVSRCFGELHFPKIMGLVMSGFALGIIVGIPVAAGIFDNTGSYEIAFVGCIVFFVISAVLAALIKPERYQGEFETQEVQVQH